LDKDWTTLGNARELKLNLIPDGMHRLRLRVAGDKNQREASFVIYKPISLWRQPRIQVFAAVLFSLLLVVITVTYIGIVRRRERRKTQLNKQYANIELKALQSQLNPHFIFNCLNSIQHFILTNDEKSAMKYLTKFSSLMRMFLEHSKSNTVSLHEECELLKLYVEIESLRFKNGFDFKIEVEEGIDVYNIQIPSMLFQPFVENAIKHGLLNLDRRGRLNISFSIKNSELIGVIDDDGVGRKRAKELESKEHNKHQSRGMEITTDRIDAINYIENTNISVEVIDRVNGGEAAGTRILIKIPI
jgi:LytS/YehU family sensor histidine kinase